MHHAASPANDALPSPPDPSHAAVAAFARFAPAPLLRRMAGIYAELSDLAQLRRAPDDYAAPLAAVRAEIEARRDRDRGRSGRERAA